VHTARDSTGANRGCHEYTPLLQGLCARGRGETGARDVLRGQRGLQGSAARISAYEERGVQRKRLTLTSLGDSAGMQSP
jgi:hypothetical protein